MIEKKTVCQIVDEWLDGKEYFLVEVAISPDDKIVVEIDHKEGVWIEDCVELSRYIESKLNREDEDYELEVGSAGIGQPFKVLQQYTNHIGKEVEVLRKDGWVLAALTFLGEAAFSPVVHNANSAIAKRCFFIKLWFLVSGAILAFFLVFQHIQVRSIA